MKEAEKVITDTDGWCSAAGRPVSPWDFLKAFAHQLGAVFIYAENRMGMHRVDTTQALFVLKKLPVFLVSARNMRSEVRWTRAIEVIVKPTHPLAKAAPALDAKSTVQCSFKVKQAWILNS